MSDFEEKFPSLKGEECHYCESPDINQCFSIPSYWWGRLFGSEKIELHCRDKQRIREAIHGSVLSMSKFKEGEVKEALDEYINILYERLNLED